MCSLLLYFLSFVSCSLFLPSCHCFFGFVLKYMLKSDLVEKCHCSFISRITFLGLQPSTLVLYMKSKHFLYAILRHSHIFLFLFNLASGHRKLGTSLLVPPISDKKMSCWCRNEEMLLDFSNRGKILCCATNMQLN